MTTNDFAEREIALWLEVLPALDIDRDELLAATRLTRLLSVQNRLDAVAVRDFDRVGIVGPEDFKLVALLRRSGPAGLTNAELVSQLHGSKSGTSNRLDRLVAGGVVARSPIPHDRRTHANVLTPRGEEVADELLLAVAAARHKLFTAMSPGDISKFAATLGQILEEVDPDV